MIRPPKRAMKKFRANSVVDIMAESAVKKTSGHKSINDNEQIGPA